MDPRRAASAILVRLAAPAACDTGAGTRADEAAPARAPLTGVRWTVDSVTIGAERTGAPDRAHFTIDAEGGVTGDLGCNRFRGGALSGSTITFDGIGTTRTM
ncbi:META domain-containing protein [Streptomyces sp. PTD5-9]|uniref:META domain-containing protein n=1 Tax=Streptomyces sp. PTD5-9 TaxID=3120150 RepID=UPI0030095475